MAKKSSRPPAAEKSKSKSSAKRAASAKKDADAPAKKQATKKAAKKTAAKKATKKTAKKAAKKTAKKAAAPAKQEAPARAAAPVKPSKKAVKPPGKSAAVEKKASKKVAAPTPEPMPAPIEKPARASKKAGSKTDVAPPMPAPMPAKGPSRAKKAAAKTDVAPPTPAPTPAAPSKPAKKASRPPAKQVEPEPASGDDDDDGQTPAAARTGGAESVPSRVFRGFGPGLFEFLAELALNNERSWFEAHKRRYESELREPALAFIRAMGSRLAELSKHFVASDQKVGGSLMRIHRDTRFSPDKPPYKTNLGVQFRHASGKDVHAPGLYFHVDNEGVFLGSGTWHPEPEPLAAIRNAIAEQPDAWQRARDDAHFREHWALEGDSLSRPPRGFDKQHPLVDDLRRKDHIAVCRMSADEIMRPDMVDRITERFVASAPYLRFLCGAIGVAF